VGVGDKLYAALLDRPIPRLDQVETRSVALPLARPTRADASAVESRATSTGRVS
jgi:hypothetical protein